MQWWSRRRIDLTPKMEAVLDYAFKLTATPHAMAEIDIERLRKDNLADEDILTVNRIALGLGGCIYGRRSGRIRILALLPRITVHRRFS